MPLPLCLKCELVQLQICEYLHVWQQCESEERHDKGWGWEIVMICTFLFMLMDCMLSFFSCFFVFSF